MNFSGNVLAISLISLLIFIAIRPVWREILIAKVQHLIFGCAAVLSLLWWMHASIYQGLEVHLFGLTAITLILGWRWALLSSLIINLVLTSMGHLSWSLMPMFYILTSIVPIAFSYLMYTLAYHKLPRHFFVYTFFCAFFVGALSIAITMASWASFLYFSDTYSWQILVDNYLLLIPLLLFPEGLINGMAMTLLIVYKPDWVKTFYDNQYLDK